ncbi:response regulator transcription factor [Caulobacter sp. RHG1]|uniref:LuxR C-terminal-related transcriptional regulator n=1 Tax=Caulobacter sp. (strain RHG1) TaxID=2545762 RepID=UPI0015582F37|nr:response regulator transcription factor [Caulobacter sp. RHG1]NQE61241.1 hypothetical protein [Caulobacter sp. RHG1]
MRVLIIDSHPLMREAIRTVTLSAWPKAHTVEVGDLTGIEAGCRFGAAIDLVVMDPALPGATGLSALIQVKQRLPHTPVVIFASRRDDEMVGFSRALDAAAFIHKSACPSEMVDVLRAVFTGARLFPTLNGSTTIQNELAAMRKRLDALTATQLKVLLSIADGRLNKQVAADMHVSEAAIKAHLTAIFRKLGVHNRAQAMLALRPILTDGAAAA